MLDRPSIRPVSPALGLDIVTSSQTLREKDIQPSKLNFGFLGLGKQLTINIGTVYCHLYRKTGVYKEYRPLPCGEGEISADVIGGKCEKLKRNRRRNVKERGNLKVIIKLKAMLRSRSRKEPKLLAGAGAGILSIGSDSGSD